MGVNTLSKAITGVVFGVGVGMYISYRYIWNFMRYAQDH